MIGVHEGTLTVLRDVQGQSPLLVKVFGATPETIHLSVNLLGLPQNIINALWGGCLGIPLASYLCRGPRVPMLASGAFYGVGVVGGLLLVLLPTLGGWPVLGFSSRQVISLTVVLCAGWGWATALLLKVLTRR